MLTGLGAEWDSVDALAFETLIPKNVVERYVALLVEHGRLILCGPTGTGKTHLAARLAKHLVRRSVSPPVLLSLALVLGLEVSSLTNFESLALALALSKSPWPRQIFPGHLGATETMTCDCLVYSFDSFVAVYCMNLCHC